jgi:hypothetical protein
MFKLEIYTIYIRIKHFQFTPALIQACKITPYRDPIKIITSNNFRIQINEQDQNSKNVRCVL